VIEMAKMTKAQAKRLVKSIEAKTQKLFLWYDTPTGKSIVNASDMIAIEKLTDKWLKRIK
tara:strand:- start:646 stop:825 length:180 start_codon:yes stop_codon:yes gene_type:complete